MANSAQPHCNRSVLAEIIISSGFRGDVLPRGLVDERPGISCDPDGEGSNDHRHVVDVDRAESCFGERSGRSGRTRGRLRPVPAFQQGQPEALCPLDDDPMSEVEPSPEMVGGIAD